MDDARTLALDTIMLANVDGTFPSEIDPDAQSKVVTYESPFRLSRSKAFNFGLKRRFHNCMLATLNFGIGLPKVE